MCIFGSARWHRHSPQRRASRFLCLIFNLAIPPRPPAAPCPPHLTPPPLLFSSPYSGGTVSKDENAWRRRMRWDFCRIVLPLPPLHWRGEKQQKEIFPFTLSSGDKKKQQQSALRGRWQHLARRGGWFVQGMFADQGVMALTKCLCPEQSVIEDSFAMGTVGGSVEHQPLVANRGSVSLKPLQRGFCGCCCCCRGGR